ncbi:CRISPR-associated helicase/endonuclease Cas3 [soil metagenome]
MMDPKRLWAKSYKDGETEHPSMLLHNHLEDVWRSAGQVLDATAVDQLLALGLKPDLYLHRLRNCVLLAAAVHDLGKANDHFQGMLRWAPERRGLQQGLRHEWVTLLMLQPLKAWLLPAVQNSETDFAIVEWAVTGHHPAHHHASPPRESPEGSGVSINMLCAHKDFEASIAWIRKTFKLAGDVPSLQDHPRFLDGMRDVHSAIPKWSNAARKLWGPCKPEEKRFVAAVKNCMIAADVAGSALPQKLPDDPERWDWITQSFNEKPKEGDLQKIADHRLGGHPARAFQNDVANSAAGVTFVKAGCGSGKTLAAYLWAAQQHPTRRLCFCYPTTGTATEGFKDYLLDVDVNADLFHSRREVDFEIILNTGRDTGENDTAIRIESLDAWSTPIVACTVDAVLGLVQNNRRGLYAWPALAQSAFVFDEIHAFDDRLFGALLRFLRDLPGLPVLLMTASLPAPREEALRTVLRKFRNIELKPIAGPAELEELARYRKATVPNNDPLQLIENEIEAGGKVLWVCNTVKRVMAAAESAKHLDPKIYHSRFKYEDRVQRHKEVIAAFDPKHLGPALAICSQVAEMSLDLKGCTLLVTDVATVPAIIQRLGRLNRQATKDDETRPFVLIDPENNLPYTTADLEAVKAWHQKLPDDGISQKHLAEAWEQTAENPPDLIASAWLDGGPVTSVLELREGSPGITVLIQDDVSKVKANPKSLGRYTLPMPPCSSWREWTDYKGIPIAPASAIEYDAKRGAKWQSE